MESRKSPPFYVVERTAWLAGKTCGSEGGHVQNYVPQADALQGQLPIVSLEGDEPHRAGRFAPIALPKP